MSDNVVSSEVNINKTKINDLNNAIFKALEQTAEALRAEIVVDQVMPFDTGTLQNNATAPDFSNVQKGETEIVSNTPYARRMYYHPEYNFQTKENKNAKGEWYEDYISGGKKDFAQDTFKKLYKKEAGL